LWSEPKTKKPGGCINDHPDSKIVLLFGKTKLQDEIRQAPPFTEWPGLIEKVEALMHPYIGNKRI